LKVSSKYAEKVELFVGSELAGSVAVEADDRFFGETNGLGAAVGFNGLGAVKGFSWENIIFFIV
jgi:hypothetical protein